MPPVHQITPRKRAAIVALSRTGMKYKDIATEYGISKSGVGHIVNLNALRTPVNVILKNVLVDLKLPPQEMISLLNGALTSIHLFLVQKSRNNCLF